MSKFLVSSVSGRPLYLSALKQLPGHNIRTYRRRGILVGAFPAVTRQPSRILALPPVLPFSFVSRSKRVVGFVKD